jgi:DNA polymerase-1
MKGYHQGPFHTDGAAPLLLIDGDQFLLRASAAVEKEVRWDEQNHVLYSNAHEAYDNLTAMLQRIFTRFGSTEHRLCFGKGPYFRHTIDENYKAGRARKPLCFALLREKVETDFNCVTVDGLEADDVMGILATQPRSKQRIVVSIDKDMKSVPTQVWDGVDLVTVSEQEADLAHLMQTLCGDTTDGYKGCPGVGPVAAGKLLSRERRAIDEKSGRIMPSDWEVVVEAFEKAKLTEEHALKQARLARILRWTDWDNALKQPILWTPPK